MKCTCRERTYSTFTPKMTMSRPHVSDDLAQVVEEIYHNQKGRKPASFEDALEAVVQLANESPQQEGWYPGKYAGEAVSRVFRQENSTQTSTNSNVTQDASLQASQFQLDPDTQAIFKQAVSEDATITIPEAERTALSITPGDLLQVIVYQSNAVNGSESDQ